MLAAPTTFEPPPDEPDVAGPAYPRAHDAAAGAPPLTLREVYEAHWQFVWRALRALGVREADLDDQTHEVFLVVHRKLATFEGRARVTTWLFSIAERVASDHRRRAHVRRERATEPMPERDDVAAATTHGAPDADLEQRQARAALDAILDGLPPEQRVVFVLFELDGLPADEIAAIVSAPVNTVYSRLRLARKHVEQAAARLRARGVL